MAATRVAFIAIPFDQKIYGQRNLIFLYIRNYKYD